MKTFYKESELVFAEKPINKQFHDLTGQVFERLTVLGFAGRNLNSQWFCRCECGNILRIFAGCLKRGTTKSCGCLIIELTKERNTMHGHAIRGNSSLTYKTWRAMIQRCYDQNHLAYPNYGGRGITICDRWRNSFENFIEDMGERPKGKTIERIENDKGYYKENCRYSTRKEQNNNKRDNHLLNFNGKTQTVAQWAMEIGVDRKLIYGRLNQLGWSTEKALTTPLMVKFSHSKK